MAKNEKNTIIIDEVEHNIEDLTEQQIALVNHVRDLDRKIASAQFNLDQLSVGRQSFGELLKKSFEEE